MSAEIPRCPVCGQPLSLRLAHGRKSGKPFVMLICAQDGRHFRGFISDRTFVKGVVEHLEGRQRIGKGEKEGSIEKTGAARSQEHPECQR